MMLTMDHLPHLPEILRLAGILLMGGALLCALWYSRKRQPQLASPEPTSLRDGIGLFLVFLTLRLGLLFLTVLLRKTISGGDLLPSLSDTLNRWDAPHYLWIAENGYQAVTPDSDGYLFIVFFPLYPWLVSLLGGGVTAGVLLNCVLSAATSLILYLWTLQQGQNRLTALMAGVLWQIFPLSFFQMAPYTESLFVLLTASTLYAIACRRYIAAGILGFFATLTRNVGVLLILPGLIAILYDIQKEGLWPSLKNAIWLLLIPIGMLTYLGINDHVYGDPFMFMKIQKIHWYQGFGFFGDTIRYITENFLRGSDPGRWYLWGSELAAICLTLIFLPAILRPMTPGERAYTILYVIFILSPTWLLSYPRYLMGLAPLYPALSRLFFSGGRIRKVLGCFVILLFLITLYVLTYGFLSGQQVL